MNLSCRCEQTSICRIQWSAVWSGLCNRSGCPHGQPVPSTSPPFPPDSRPRLVWWQTNGTAKIKRNENIEVDWLKASSLPSCVMYFVSSADSRYPFFSLSRTWKQQLMSSSFSEQYDVRITAGSTACFLVYPIRYGAMHLSDIEAQCGQGNINKQQLVSPQRPERESPYGWEGT